jgi:16S rRNA (guanine527-N7)-methyltransferase
VDTARIAQLLEPYVEPPARVSAGSPALDSQQLSSILTYINVLLRWNSRMNLTAVREPEQIVRRHFGESLFAARLLFPDAQDQSPVRVIDLGSGAGFPGIPMKLWHPRASVTLIESNSKKVAFLREVIRAITLIDINVFDGRGEEYSGPPGDVVTGRAVEKFEDTLPVAANLVAPGGRLSLLIGEPQVQAAKKALPWFQWGDVAAIPESSSRVLFVGRRNSGG